MKLHIFSDAASVAFEAARFIAARANARVGHNDLFTAALSGGRTPGKMFEQLATLDVPWDKVHWLQVDERVAPAGDATRNYTHLQRVLVECARVPQSMLHPMPVEDEDLELAAVDYAQQIERIAGLAPSLDLVHLGLGADGHTASLIPGDAVIDVNDVDVALTREAYQGRRRMTLTYPAINRAREILWLVTGTDKQNMLARLLDGDTSIPAGRIDSANAVVFADEAAAGTVA